MQAPRALIVDDNQMNLDLASFLLESDGWSVATACDAAQARTQLPTFKPQVVLLDIQLPDLDGLSFARQLKADPRTRHIAIMAFTAYAMQSDEAKARDAGCDGYMSKPIDVTNFATRVRALLDVTPP